MGLKPGLESSHERRYKMLFFGRHRQAWADTALNQVAVKELHPKLRVVAGPSAVRLRAAAPRQVAAKILQRRCVNIGQSSAFALHKTAKVSCGAEVPNGGRVGIPSVLQCFREPIDMRSAEARAQASKRLRRGEILLDQGVLLRV
jgi:hypothetical protein